MWAISRTVGVPVGPQPWRPEAVAPIDVLSTLDKLAAVILVGVVLAALRGRSRPSISQTHLRVASMVTGLLFIYSLMAPFPGGHHHH